MGTMSTKKEEVKATKVEETKIEGLEVGINNPEWNSKQEDSKTEEEEDDEINDPKTDYSNLKLISNFNELEKAEDLKEFLQDIDNCVPVKNLIAHLDSDKDGWIIGNKYFLTLEEFKYFTEVVYPEGTIKTIN